MGYRKSAGESVRLSGLRDGRGGVQGQVERDIIGVHPEHLQSAR